VCEPTTGGGFEVARYESYLASGSDEPYSLWLGNKFREFYEVVEGRPLSGGDGSSHGVAVTTEAERRSATLLYRGDEFDAWLAAGARR
jgi:hypothetical protein